MASSDADSQWKELQDIIVNWIELHEINMMDEIVALWLDDTGKLKNSYVVGQ